MARELSGNIDYVDSMPGGDLGDALNYTLNPVLKMRMGWSELNDGLGLHHYNSGDAIDTVEEVNQAYLSYFMGSTETVLVGVAGVQLYRSFVVAPGGVADDAVAGAGDDVIGKRPLNDHYVSQKQALGRRYSNQGVHDRMRHVKRMRAGRTNAEITKKLTKQVDDMLLPGNQGEVFIPSETLPSAKYMRGLEKVLDWY